VIFKKINSPWKNSASNVAISENPVIPRLKPNTQKNKEENKEATKKGSGLES
jgi:hypothetical protein